MAGKLTEEEARRFKTEGYAYPFFAISEEEASECVNRLDQYDEPLGGEAQKQLKIKGHLAAPGSWNLPITKTFWMQLNPL